MSRLTHHLGRSVLAGFPQLGRSAGLFMLLSVQAESWRTDFSVDPFSAVTPRWSVIGDSDLFRWNPGAQQLDITWDSSRPNSFCLWPLPRALSSRDACGFAFDFRLADAGPREGSHRNNVLQISVVLGRRSRMPDGYPLRTSAGRAADLLDFSFFPLADYGPFGSAAFISPVAFGESSIGYSFGNSYDLADGQSHRVECTWDPLTRVLRTNVEGAGRIADTSPALGPNDDFVVDTFAVVVWNEAATPQDSLLAHGSIRAVTVTAPEPLVGKLTFTEASREVSFQSQPGYRYRLEASGDLLTWASTGDADGVLGTGRTLSLTDSREALFLQQFYRVRATPTP